MCIVSPVFFMDLWNENLWLIFFWSSQISGGCLHLCMEPWTATWTKYSHTYLRLSPMCFVKKHHVIWLCWSSGSFYGNKATDDQCRCHEKESFNWTGYQFKTITESKLKKSHSKWLGKQELKAKWRKNVFRSQDHRMALFGLLKIHCREWPAHNTCRFDLVLHGIKLDIWTVCWFFNAFYYVKLVQGREGVALIYGLVIGGSFVLILVISRHYAVNGW